MGSGLFFMLRLPACPQTSPWPAAIVRDRRGRRLRTSAQPHPQERRDQQAPRPADHGEDDIQVPHRPSPPAAPAADLEFTTSPRCAATTARVPAPRQACRTGGRIAPIARCPATAVRLVAAHPLRQRLRIAAAASVRTTRRAPPTARADQARRPQRSPIRRRPASRRR